MNERDQAWQGFIQIVTRDPGSGWDLSVSQAWQAERRRREGDGRVGDAG